MASVRIQRQADCITAYLNGDIDHHTAKRMREEIDQAVESSSPNKLILDFSAVSFMDSSGIGLVMGRYKTLNLCGGKELEVKNAANQIVKVMRLAGLDKLAKIDKEDNR